MKLDKHALYLRAVQTPEVDVDFFDRVFRKRSRRAPISLREDFCGSAALCAAWVESDDDREAVGVDLDRKVLKWGEKHVLGELDEGERERITLVFGDARKKSARTFDIIAAPNFSWALFDRRDLELYLGNARACLEDDGILVLEIFGGSDLRRPLREEHVLDGFTYVWEHERFDESQQRLHAAIHFRVGRRRIDRAFRYSFRLWSHDELLAMLREAGFSKCELHVEIAGARFRKRASAPRVGRYNGYLIALA